MKTFFSSLRGYWGAIRLFFDPTRLDEVFALDSLVDREETLGRIVDAMRAHPDGARSLAERPRLVIDLVALRAMPEGTFGRAVADFFDQNELDPKSIPTLEATDDAKWAQAHLYETHDVWHVATGFSTDVAGELGLQAVYAAQIPGRLAQLLIAGGLLQAALLVQGDFHARLASVARGWELGRRGPPLFGVRWDELYEAPLSEVRARFAA